MGFLPFTTKATETEATSEQSSDRLSVIDDGNLQFTAGGGANSSKLTYQEASGAPIEAKSPLGYSVGAVTVIFLNLSMMIGTGVFSTREYSYVTSRLLQGPLGSILHENSQS